ncbi:hypothetical protein P5673_000968 [Acropora cervicornis]|uniref:Uncharacterized protein n=1 Tax=Acropora cervicornis TaxID=6130 RepID=A0AAD9R5P3_ACRCE|nr:hypothetical protein P5673_000968 [Acropora cervicornis]
MPASKCAIFVCNKWNLIREKEYNEVKSHIVKKLKRYCPDLILKHRSSTYRPRMPPKAQNLGIITNEFSSSMETVRMMIIDNDSAKRDYILWITIVPKGSDMI